MSLTIGQRLKKAREHKRLTLEQASEATRIRMNFLQALETDDYSIIPSAAQGRGFLRNYAEYLGVDIDGILAEIQKEAPTLAAEISGPLPHVDDLPEETPPIVSASEEKTPTLPFLTRFLPRKPKTESAPETISIQEAEPVTDPQPQPVEPVPVVEEKPVKPRGRKKKIVEAPAISETPPVVEETKPEAEPVPVAPEQTEVQSEAQTEALLPKYIRRARSLLMRKKTPPRLEPIEEKEEKIVPAEETKSSEAVETPEEIFVSIGNQLRKQRELISLTLDEVELHTKLRAVFLKDMEDGALEKLPSPVQTRGMLANYASFLDLDVDAILLRFADALQARHRQKYPDKLRSKDLIKVASSIPPLRSFMAGDLIFGLGMIVVLAALAIWGVGRVMNSQQTAQSFLPTAPSISDVLAGTPQPTPVQEVTFIPLAGTQFSAATEAEATTTAEPIDVNVQVILTVVERAFVRVSVDGKVIFEGRVVPGDSYTYDAEDQISVLTGNGAALMVRYNGRDLGLMGNFGQVVSQVYLISGLVTATPTVPPTATNTPLVTDTPTMTVTPTTTGTPTVTATP